MPNPPGYYRSWYSKRRAEGKCTRCTNDAEGGKSYCRWCWENVSEANKARREERKNLAICVQCGRPGMGMYITCDVCRAKKIDERDRRRLKAVNKPDSEVA